MTDRPPEYAESRQESFACQSPADVDLHLDDGPVSVRMSGEPGIRVTISPGPFAPQAPDAVARLLRETRVDWQAQEGRLVVRGPRRASLTVEVAVPERSRVGVHAGSGSVDVSGTAGRLAVHTGSGDVTADAVEGGVAISSGSGNVKLGPVAGGLRYRAGSGRFEAESLEGHSRLATGNGDISLGSVASDVVARTGNGDVRVADASGGKLVLATGHGDIWVGIREGSIAELDLASGSGTARSELPVADRPPSRGAAAVRVKARTGSGEAVVARAAG